MRDVNIFRDIFKTNSFFPDLMKFFHESPWLFPGLFSKTFPQVFPDFLVRGHPD